MNQKASRLFAVILIFAAGLWLFVPVHEFLRAWGRLVLIAGFEGRVELELMPIVQKQIRVLGSLLSG